MMGRRRSSGRARLPSRPAADAASLLRPLIAPAQKSKKPKVEGSKDDIFGADAGAKGRKKTEEGYAIYTEDELQLGAKGGETDQCPFDCECCF